MKKILTIISGLTLFASNFNNIFILGKSDFDTGSNQQDHFADNFQNYNKFVNVIKTKQEQKYYCVPASVQSLFLTLGAQEQRYSQDAIYNYFQWIYNFETGQGITFEGPLLDYINNNIRRFNPELINRFTFSLLFNDTSIGHDEEEALLFQNFIISNLSENIPVIFGTSSRVGYMRGHAIVIRGIETARNPLDTIYWYLNPRTGENSHRFTGRDLVTMTNNGLRAIGINANNFDFSKKEIKVKVDEEKFEKDLQMGIRETVAVQINLTQEAGITSIASIQKFNQLNLNHYSNQISWKDKNKIFKEEIWFTKYFWMNNKINWHILGSQSINDEDLAYKTEYASILWNNYSGGLMLTLKYRFQLNAESGKYFNVKNIVSLGDIITLKF